MKSCILFLLVLLVAPVALAQVRISGKVTDKQTGEVLPFVSVYVKNTSSGTSTDLHGNFIIKLAQAPDSLTVSYLGYGNQSRAVKSGLVTQTLDFALEAAAHSLQEVVIRPTENPAFRIMRQVVARKQANDKRQLAAYQYEAYTRIRFDIDNREAKRKKGVNAAISALVDSSLLLTGEDGRKTLPFFISESLSDYYYNREPEKTKEVVKYTRMAGVGMQEDDFIAGLLGASYQNINFYQNWIPLLQKNFISPIADSWKSDYTYELLDSLYVGEDWCYKLEVKQKQPQELAFNGLIWITADSYALRKIDVRVSKSANLNFVENILLKQELAPTQAGAWLPVKTKLNLKINGLGASWPDILASIVTAGSKVVVNRPQPAAFFAQPVELAPAQSSHSDEIWARQDTTTLQPAGRQVYALVDSIKTSPKVVRFTHLLELLTSGYRKAGKLSWGPVPYAYAYNNVEGHRFQIGVKTNTSFSRSWQLKGYAAYGTQDRRAKYGAKARYIFSRKNWSEAGLAYSRELQELGLPLDMLAANPLFAGFSRFGRLENPMMVNEQSAYLQRDLVQGVTQRLTLRSRQYRPQFDFSFHPPGRPEQLLKDFATTEVSYLARLTRKEVFIERDNERVSLGNGRRPVLTFCYTLGLKEIMGGDLEYQRVDVGLSQRLLMGRLGKAFYQVEGGRIFSAVPYPLLELHLGNETPFYYNQAFQLMNSFEFVSDTYASLRYEQHLEGLLFDRLPLIRKLKWRTLVSANILYGSWSPKHQALLPPVSGTGREPAFASFTDRPYVELGYGIENILKVFRVDAFHRLSYLDRPGAGKFGLKCSVQFKL